MKKETIYDVLGIGIGPFNLGLAAIASDIPELKCKFFDQSQSFNWHPGLLLKNTRLQVPFYADLVTGTDPTNQFSFMNFLKINNRMFRFAIQENNFVTRIEYNQYCQWVASQLQALQFGLKCEAIRYDKNVKIYTVYLTEPGGFTVRFHGKQIVIGVGTVPFTPECANDIEHPMIIHSSDYLFKKTELLKSKKITIVGSGQSAAEIFYDLLSETDQLESLSWFTRSSRFFPMDYSKFALEMTSPDYIDYFFNLPDDQKKKVLETQEYLYKGINLDLIRDIFNELYTHKISHSKVQIQLCPGQSLGKIESLLEHRLHLSFLHLETGKHSTHETNGLILATGYKNIIPGFLDPVKELIRFRGDGLYDVQRNYSIDPCNSIFVQNADLQSHGFNSADLGLGPYRNATILNTILKREQFKIERNIAFQEFGIPENKKSRSII